MDALKSKGQMYDQINLEQIPRSGFDLSHSVRGTGKLGRLIPIRNMETQPGDSIKGSTQIALQFEPLAVPMLANMRVKTEHWYIPFNTLWKDWDKFITKGQDLSDDSSVPTFTFKRAFNLVTTDLIRDHGFNISFGKWNSSDTAGTYKPVAGAFVKQREILDFLGKKLEGFRTKTVPPMSWALKYQVDDLFDYVVPLFEQMLQVVKDAETVKLAPSDSNLYIPLTKSLISDSAKTFTISASQYASADASRAVSNSGSSVRPGQNPNANTRGGRGSVGTRTYDFSAKFGLEICTYEDKYLGYMSDIDLQLRTQFPGQSGFLPSDFLNAWCRFWYDLIAPICGIGSNLDYLGYQKMLPVDFQYMYCYNLYKAIATPMFSLIASENQVQNGNQLVRFGMAMGAAWSKLINATITQSIPQIVLPLRAFYAVWWNNYRDQLLETAAPEPITDSIITDDELYLLLLPRQRAWSKDTFTTALANTGTGSVVVPVNNKLDENMSQLYELKDDGLDSASAALQDMNLKQITLMDGKVIDLPTRYLSAFHDTVIDGSGQMDGFSLDMLRRAGRAEKWIQKALIYGNRIQDALFTHWRVTIKNERLQLPEFISSSVQLVRMDTILNNTTTAESVAGDKAGFASAYDNGVNFDQYSPEIGVILSIMSVMPEQSYSAGSPRFLSKVKIFDYAFPEFAQIGMDAVYNSELVNSPMKSAVDITKVFGYQGRYYDYKCKQDEDHGQLLTEQDMYTFARKFNPYDENSLPLLNYRFIHCFPRLDMFVVNDVNADQFRFDVHHSVACSRALPVCGMSV